MREAVDKSSNQFKDWCPKVMERAKEIQANLSPEHPSFVKVMKRAHVSNSFYTCPPMQFCQKHLPKTDETIVLEIESGKSYEVKFLGSNCAFSAGWRGFAIAEKLLENDVLVFHLIGSCKFKVYIVRAKELAPVGKAPTVAETNGFATKREVEKERTCERDKKSAVNEQTVVHFTGVRKKHSGRYGAEIKISGRAVWLGTFDTAEEAALAFDAAASEYHGAKANTNFPLNRNPGYNRTTTVDSSPPSPEHHRKTKYVNKVRASGLTAVDKAPTVYEIDDFATEREVEKNRTCKRDKKRPSFVPQRILQEKVIVSDSSLKNSIHPDDSNSSLKHSNHDDDSSSSSLEGFQLFKCVSDFKNFKIKVDGTSIELPRQVREDYFKLCCSQKSYLHCNLIKGIDPILAASVISGTIDISNAIRKSKISTPRDVIAYWNKALDGFEIFGMNIGFIRARLIRLSGLALDLKRYKEAESERKDVEKKIIELKKRKRRLDEEIKGVGKVEAMYEEEASFPW